MIEQPDTYNIMGLQILIKPVCRIFERGGDKKKKVNLQFPFYMDIFGKKLAHMINEMSYS